MTREDTLEGLELCLKGLCDICPYKDSNAPGGCKDELMYDAMILLEAQEPIKPYKANIRSNLEQAPAVDAVPVVHGRWINYPECLRYESAYCEENIVCSGCHSVWNIIDNDADRFDYCPACGAKMDGERRDGDT